VSPGRARARDRRTIDRGQPRAPRRERAAGGRTRNRPARPVKRALTVLPAEAGLSLGRFLAARLRLPIEHARALVGAGSVHVGHRRVRDAEEPLGVGDSVLAYLDTPAPIAPKIIHRDTALVVVDKPPGMPVSATRQ